MNGRRKRILTSLGSLSFATLLAGIAFKRQLDKDLQKEMQGAGEKRNSPSEKWNSPSPPCFARSLPPEGKPRSGNMKTYHLSSAYADTFPEGESKGGSSAPTGKPGTRVEYKAAF